jgi:drug/metabolite transporter (DMT)-like permease
MATDQRSRGAARSIISVGHLLVGGAACVLAGVLIVAGSDSRAELEGVLLPLGVLLALAAAVFTYAAGMVLRRAPGDRHGPSLILSIIELLVGGALASGVFVAVQSYGEPWRSPLLLPSVLLVALGLAGLALEVVARRPETH